MLPNGASSISNDRIHYPHLPRSAARVRHTLDLFLLFADNVCKLKARPHSSSRRSCPWLTGGRLRAGEERCLKKEGVQFSLSLEKQHLLSVKTTVYVYIYSFIYGITDNIKKNSQFRFCKVHDTRHDMVLAPPAVRASLSLRYTPGFIYGTFSLWNRVWCVLKKI